MASMNEKAGPSQDERADEQTAPATPGSVSRSPSATLCRNKKRLPFWIPTCFGSGIISDIRARAPYYASDWLDAWNYRVIPAIVLIFSAKRVPFSNHVVAWLSA